MAKSAQNARNPGSRPCTGNVEVSGPNTSELVLALRMGTGDAASTSGPKGASWRTAERVTAGKEFEILVPGGAASGSTTMIAACAAAGRISGRGQCAISPKFARAAR
jgi:hypothetical protein